MWVYISYYFRILFSHTFKAHQSNTKIPSVSTGLYWSKIVNSFTKVSYILFMLLQLIPLVLYCNGYIKLHSVHVFQWFSNYWIKENTSVHREVGSISNLKISTRWRYLTGMDYNCYKYFIWVVIRVFRRLYYARIQLLIYNVWKFVTIEGLFYKVHRCVFCCFVNISVLPLLSILSINPNVLVSIKLTRYVVS